MVNMDTTRDELLSLDDRALLAQCEVDRFRASGPGGQKRNKTDSAVRLRHGPTKLAVVAVESRSQHENRARALKRLRHAIALNIRTPLDPETYLPGDVVRQCLTKSGKLHVGVRDHRFNLVVAEVLDLFAACDCRVSTAASKLGVSTAQLVTFIRKDTKLFARINDMRTAAGLAKIR